MPSGTKIGLSGDWIVGSLKRMRKRERGGSGRNRSGVEGNHIPQSRPQRRGVQAKITHVNGSKLAGPKLSFGQIS